MASTNMAYTLREHVTKARASNPRATAGNNRKQGVAFGGGDYDTRPQFLFTGLNDIKPKNVQKLDSIEYIPDLRKVGRKLAEEIKIEHFGNFIS